MTFPIYLLDLKLTRHHFFNILFFSTLIARHSISSNRQLAPSWSVNWYPETLPRSAPTYYEFLLLVHAARFDKSRFRNCLALCLVCFLFPAAFSSLWKGPGPCARAEQVGMIRSGVSLFSDLSCFTSRRIQAEHNDHHDPERCSCR